MKSFAITAITSVVAVTALICLSAAAPTPESNEMRQLRTQVADIGLRVSRLEHASGAEPGAVHQSFDEVGTTSVPRTMIVGGINTIQGAPADAQEVANLKNDIQALEQTLDFHKDNAARVAGDTYYVGGYYSDGHYGYNHSNAGRERAEQSQVQMSQRYGQELASKKKQLEQMQQQADELLQIVHGHDGDVIFTLRTTHDLSKMLGTVNIGDTVSWKGRRISATDTSETWQVTLIHLVDENQ